jgi:S-adenosylmethionine hydrolase
MILKQLPITSWNEQDRPREKAIDKGISALTDAELLALFVSTGTREKSAVELCDEILTWDKSIIKQGPFDHFGNLITNIPGHFIEGKTWFVAIGGLKEENTEESVQENLDKNKDKKKKKGKNNKDKIAKKTASEIESLSQVSRIIPGGRTYEDVKPGNFVALVGSHGWVEIAANQANAQLILQLEWGSRVHVLLTDS